MAAPAQPTSFLKPLQPFVRGMAGMFFLQRPMESLALWGAYELLCRNEEAIRKALVATGNWGNSYTPYMKHAGATALGATVAIAAQFLKASPLPLQTRLEYWRNDALEYTDYYFFYLAVGIYATLTAKIPSLRNSSTFSYVSEAVSAHGLISKFTRGDVLNNILNSLSSCGSAMYDFATADWFRGAVFLGLLACVLSADAVKSRFLHFIHECMHGFGPPRKERLKQLTQMDALHTTEEEATKKLIECSNLRHKVEGGTPLSPEEQAKIDAATKPKDQKDWIDRLVKVAQENIDSNKKGQTVPGTAIRTASSSYNPTATKTRTLNWLKGAHLGKDLKPLTKPLNDTELQEIMNRLKF